MHTYCRLKNGRIMIVYSDNVDEETMHLFELSELDELGNYDAEFLTTEVVAYSEIDKTNTNLAHLKDTVSIPNKRNFCGGNFQDWLEVMLTDKCNGRCSWCVDKNGYHPKKHAEWNELARKIIDCDKNNIIFLGGEPTLCLELNKIIIAVSSITNRKKKLYVTTNGSMLTPKYVEHNLYRLTGINISIHDYVMEKNRDITGISLEKGNLRAVVDELHRNFVQVRLNCNIIRGHIDSEKEIFSYLDFAKDLRVDSVRFAELKNDKDDFVNLAKIFDGKYGINNDPFVLGCNSSAVIDGMPINFRQMCGLQTDKRPKPINPKQENKVVLYYDANFYNGWQSKYGGYCMNSKKLRKLLQNVVKGTVTAETAQKKIEKAAEEERLKAQRANDAAGCCY